MTMSVFESIITIFSVIFATTLTRFLPFLIFPSHKTPPNTIQFLGNVLPYSVMGLLVVYSLKDTPLLEGSKGIPELIATFLTVFLHLWKKNMLLSIFGGTAIYMILVQFVF